MQMNYSDDLAWLFAASVDLIFLFGVGCYFLVLRFHRREEIPPLKEAGALGLALALGAMEMRFLREALERFPVYYVFSAIGVLVALSALYGHLVVSLISRALVEWVTSGSTDGLDRPLYGAAEACLRRGDYEGAVREYLVLARLHPADPAVFQRFGEALHLLGDRKRAMRAFLRAARLEKDPERAMLALRRAIDHADLNCAEDQEMVTPVIDALKGRLCHDERALAQLRKLECPEDSEPLRASKPGREASVTVPSPPSGTLGLERLDDTPLTED